MDSPTPTMGTSFGSAMEEMLPVALLIDDSPDVQRLLKMRLRTEGITVIGASTGAKGIEMALAEKPSVILLDIDMPGMDGFEVLRTLKNTDSTLNIPVIMLSGLHSAQDKVTAFDLGAVDFITKPFDVTELRVRVRSALRISQLLRMLAQRAQIDGLTGLYNRAHFDKRWVEEVASAERHKKPLSLAMFDLDKFKSINDFYGHPAGDAAIQGLAKLLQRESRQEDISCRYGGEEFVLVMPETTPDAAKALCERIRIALGKITWPRHPERKVTVSIGIAGSDGSCIIDAAKWVEAADSNLYAAKTNGRNRVVCSPVDGNLALAQAS